MEVDFAEADLNHSEFDSCDFDGAIFEQTILDGANLSTSSNITLDPDNNYIYKTIFSQEGAIGLLAKYDIIIK